MQNAITHEKVQRGIPCEVISWDRFYQLSQQLAHTIHATSLQPDLIIAIGRGGYIPARILSDHLNVFDLDSIKIEHYHALHKEKYAKIRYPAAADITDRRVLLVDDVNDSGDTFRVAIRHLRKRGKPAELQTAVLHHKNISGFIPDYYAEQVVEWRWIIYPWAVIEDLTSLLQGMDPRPASVDKFAAGLLEKHGIEVSPRVLEEVIVAVTGAHGRPSPYDLSQ